MFKFKLVLIYHFLSVCVVPAVASGKRVGLSQGSSTRGPPAARERYFTKYNALRILKLESLETI